MGQQHDGDLVDRGLASRREARGCGAGRPTPSPDRGQSQRLDRGTSLGDREVRVAGDADGVRHAAGVGSGAGRRVQSLAEPFEDESVERPRFVRVVRARRRRPGSVSRVTRGQPPCHPAGPSGRPAGSRRRVTPESLSCQAAGHPARAAAARTMAGAEARSSTRPSKWAMTRSALAASSSTTSSRPISSRIRGLLAGDHHRRAWPWLTPPRASSLESSPEKLVPARPARPG